MKYVYMLQHKRKVENDATETKFIGYYSSRKKVDDTIERYKLIRTCLKSLKCDKIKEYLQSRKWRWCYAKSL